jgi:hypothetical protein
MYAADEFYPDFDEFAPWVEPCRFITEAEVDESGFHPVRCGKPAVDDEDEPLCAEHLG